jgi:hypothetical protein
VEVIRPEASPRKRESRPNLSAIDLKTDGGEKKQSGRLSTTEKDPIGFAEGYTN